MAQCASGRQQCCGAVGTGVDVRDRRAWDAYRAAKDAIARRLRHASALPVWRRLVRRRLARRFATWHRKAALTSTVRECAQLAVQHRLYLLRKLVLTQHWRRVAHAFAHWVRLCRAYVRCGQRVQRIRQRERVRLAWRKWMHCVRVERLDEELAACICVMWTRRVDKAIARSSRRGDRALLVSCWLEWKHWYRRQRCLAWRRGFALASRRCFLAWKRLYAEVIDDRLQRRRLVMDVVGGVIDDAIAQVMLHEKLRQVHRSRLAALETWQRIIAMRLAHAQRERLMQAFGRWTTTASEPKKTKRVERSDTEPTESAPTRRNRLTLPQRVALASKRRAAAPTEKPLARPHRRSWR